MQSNQQKMTNYLTMLMSSIKNNEIGRQQTINKIEELVEFSKLLEHEDTELREEIKKYKQKCKILKTVADEAKVLEMETKKGVEIKYKVNNILPNNIFILSESDEKTYSRMRALIQNSKILESLVRCRNNGTPMLKKEYDEMNCWVEYDYYRFICVCCEVGILRLTTDTTPDTKLNFYGVDLVVAKNYGCIGKRYSKYLFQFLEVNNSKNYNNQQIKENFYSTNGGTRKFADVIFNICEYHERMVHRQAIDWNRSMKCSITSFYNYDRPGYNNNHELLIFPISYYIQYKKEIYSRKSKTYDTILEKLEAKNLKKFSIKIDYIKLNKPDYLA